MTKKIIYFLFGLILFCYTIKAQQSNDAGMWNTITIQHSLTKKINLVVDQEFRLRENYQRINLFYTNIGIDYKYNKFLKITPTYRTIQKKTVRWNV